jgi:hypothetical protein
LGLLLSVAVTIAHVGTYAPLGVMAAGKFSFYAMRNIVWGILSCRGREIAVYLLPACSGAKILIGILSGERFCLLLSGAGLQAIGRVSYGGDLFTFRL